MINKTKGKAWGEMKLWQRKWHLDWDLKVDDGGKINAVIQVTESVKVSSTHMVEQKNF